MFGVQRIHVAYIRDIKDMYNRAKTQLRTMGEDFEHFLVKIDCIKDHLLAPFCKLGDG